MVAIIIIIIMIIIKVVHVYVLLQLDSMMFLSPEHSSVVVLSR